MVHRNLRRPALFVLPEEIELALCSDIDDVSQADCPVYRIPEDIPAVGLEDASVRILHIALHPHDALVCRPPGQDRHCGAVRHKEQVRILDTGKA